MRRVTAAAIVLPWALLLVMLVTFTNSTKSTKPAAVPNRGQLLLAAAAYTSNQAEAVGAAIVTEKALRVRMLPGGDAVVTLRVVFRPDPYGDARRVLSRLVDVRLRRSLWRGVTYHIRP